jgi:hypothetical protein
MPSTRHAHNGPMSTTTRTSCSESRGISRSVLLGSSRLRRIAQIGLRWCALFHRWAGVGLCLLIALWFASGVVLHFVPYPALSKVERLERSAKIDLSRVRVGPLVALPLDPTAKQMRLVDIAGRPAYILESGDGHAVAVNAETGLPLILSSADARQVASAFQRAVPIRVEGPLTYDQWTVAEEFDPYRPFFRLTFADPASTQVYVSARTGEVLQRTAASQRFWNWLGANIHWIYFSALRIHGSIWERVVWWVSMVAVLSTAAGVLLGWIRLASARGTTRGGLTPFRGWLGWHHRIGLFAGTFALTWVFSGWLSMDDGRLFPSGQPSSTEEYRAQGRPLKSIAASASLSRIRRCGEASEVLFRAINGRAFLVARGAGQPTRVSWLDATDGESFSQVPVLWLIAGVRAAWPEQPIEDRGEVRPDRFYSLSEGVGPGARVMHVAGQRPVDVYVDQVSGRLVSVMDARRKTYAWLYYGLHTFKFPGLAANPTLRHVAVLVPLGLGLAFSITGVVVAVLRLRATIRQPTRKASAGSGLRAP